MNTDVVLINPPRVNGLTRRPGYVAEPHLGLSYVSAVLRRDGFSVRYIDGDASGMTVDDVAAEVEKEDPIFAGITAPTALVKSAAATADAIKRRNPERRTVIGGYHATALPDETLTEFPGFDFALSGEGEIAALALTKALAEDRGVDAIPGVAYRSDKGVAYQGSAMRVQNLDDLPFPAWNLFPLKQFRGHYRFDRNVLELPMNMGRGCLGRCRFCARVTGDQIRRRSAEGVVEEILYNLDDYGAGAIVFMDETFAADPELVTDVCRRIIDEKLHRRMYWLCMTRVDSVDRELLALMGRAGCRHISFGVESGDAEILRRSGKKTEMDRVRRSVRDAKDAGILVDNFFILGLNGETRATLKKTVDFAVELDSAFANFFIMVPYPGTKLFEMARRGEGGLQLVSADWDHFGIQIGRALESTGLSRSVLERAQLLAYMRFYLRPRKIRNMFRIVNLKILPTYFWNLAIGWFQRSAHVRSAA